MKKSEYLKLKNQIEQEFLKKVEALEMVWEMSGGNDLEGIIPPARGGITVAVKKFVSDSASPFNIFDVENEVKKTKPDARRVSVSTVLRRMVQSNEIEIYKSGSGRTPHVFRKIVNQSRKEVL